MAKETVDYNPEKDSQQVRTVLRNNPKSERDKYGSKIIRREQNRDTITTDFGTKISVSDEQYADYSQMTAKERRQAIKEEVLFKAQGTFKNSRPCNNSPYPTATPFFSNGVLGEEIFNGSYTQSQLHQKLSIALNDVHRSTGQLGDWRMTHSKKYCGFWSFRFERFVRVALKGNKPYNVIISSTYKESR